MRNKKKFACLILTHGRPDRVYTYNLLRNCGYTGRIYFVIDNEDATADEYIAKFGKENVIMFDKLAISLTFDTADTQNDRRAIVYARNASYGIAKDLGLDYFLQLDDDYHAFRFRFIDGDTLGQKQIKDLNKIFDAMLDFLEDTNAESVAFAQGGDLIGGIGSNAVNKVLLRKTMNSWFLRTDRPVNFLGRINEDVNAYVLGGIRGQVFLTIYLVMLDQTQTQSNAGGMTELYKESGTYLKSMYTVMMAPSCVSIQSMGPSNPRLHHRIKSNFAAPKIINERYVKQ